ISPCEVAAGADGVDAANWGSGRDGAGIAASGAMLATRVWSRWTRPSEEDLMASRPLCTATSSPITTLPSFSTTRIGPGVAGDEARQASTNAPVRTKRRGANDTGELLCAGQSLAVSYARSDRLRVRSAGRSAGAGRAQVLLDAFARHFTRGVSCPSVITTI